MTSIEIKAQVFDILAAMEQPQNQLNQLGQLKNQKLQELQAALQVEAQAKEQAEILAKKQQDEKQEEPAIVPVATAVEGE